MNKLYEEITVISVLYQENFEILSKCLESVKDFKIILVDNANNKILKKKIEEKFTIYKYILNKNNLGFSKGINQAIKLSDTKFILNIEADCIIKDESIRKLLEKLNEYENCIITTPTMYDEKDNLSHSGGTLVEKNLGYKIIKIDGDICVDFPMTAAILFKKNDIIDIGMFDEDLFIYFPDIEIGRRVKSFKKSIIQVYEAKAQHNMGSLKINNPFKRVFFRNYFFTLDELIYYYKANLHTKKLSKIKKKIPLLFLQIFTNLLVLRFPNSIKCFSIILAYFRFILYLRKNN